MIGPLDALIFGIASTGSQAGKPTAVSVNAAGQLSVSLGLTQFPIYGFNGSSNVIFNVTADRSFFSGVCSSDFVTVWTPTINPRFRLMGYTLSCAGTVAGAAQVQQISLRETHPDSSSIIIFNHFATVSTGTPVGDTQVGADLGNGYLSTVAGSTLDLLITVPMLTGGVYLNCWGHEE